MLELVLELDAESRAAYLQTYSVQDPELVAELRRHLEAAEGPESEDKPEAEPGAADLPEGLEEDPTTAWIDPQEIVAAKRDPSAPPPRIGPYRVVEWLGAGGMGAVYAAERDDHEFVRRVAIKLLRAPFPSEEMVRRFRSERQILAAFDHPHIARLYEGAATHEGLPYLVMELVEGSPLPVHCDDRRLGVTDRIALFRKVCGAVQYAHSRLVVHRDLKPSNVLVTEDGEPKLLDFGIAKLLDPESFPLTVQATMTGSGPFTPHYASPEQLRGETVTTASDVYSLGVLLYMLLTDKLPYRPKRPFPMAFLELMERSDPELTSRAVLAHGRSGAATVERFGMDAQTVSRQLIGDLDNIVAKALETDTGRRYGSVEQLDDDLRRFLQGEAVSAREGTVSYRAGKFIRRHKVGVGAVLGVTGLTGAFAAAMARQAKRVTRERNLAIDAKSTAEEAVQAEEKVSEFLFKLFESANPFGAEPDVRVLDLMLRNIAEIRSSTELGPRIRARLLSSLALTLRNLGEYETALEVLLEARELAESEFPAETVDVLINLGRVYHSLNRVEEAQRALRQAIQLGEEVYGPDHQKLGVSFNLEGIIAHSKGLHEEAKGLFSRAHGIFSSTLGPDDYLTAQTSINVAGSLVQLARFSEARELLLDHMRQSGGEVSSRNSLSAIHGLGTCLCIEGDFAVSLPILERASLEAARLFGLHHPLFNRVACDWCEALGLAGEVEAARNVLALVRGAGRTDRTAEKGLSWIRLFEGFLAMRAGEYREAVAKLEKCLVDLADGSGTGPLEPHTLGEGLGTLAYCKALVGEAKEGLRLAEEGLEILRESTPAPRRQTLGLIAKARSLDFLDRQSEALETAALAIQSGKKVPTHPYTREAVEVFCDLAFRLGRDEEAREQRSAFESRLAAFQGFSMPDWLLPEGLGPIPEPSWEQRTRRWLSRAEEIAGGK